MASAALMNSVPGDICTLADAWSKSTLVRRVDLFARSLTGLTASDDSSCSSASMSNSNCHNSDDIDIDSSTCGKEQIVTEEDEDSESKSQYFDCQQSITSFDDMDMDQVLKSPNNSPVVTPLIINTSNIDDVKDHQVATYTNRQCVYSDGTPAHVWPGRCRAVVPWEFLEAHHGNQTKAQEAWHFTQQWRRQHNVWDRHTRPDPVFDHAKECYPSCYHGVTMDGFTVEYSFPGRMQASRLFHRNGQKIIHELIEHHIFFQEFIAYCMYQEECADVWQEMGKIPLKSCGGTDIQTNGNSDGDNTPSYGIFAVIDIKGAGVNLLSTDVVAFIQRLASIDCHYPLMARRILVVNAPFWTSAIFATLEPILPKTLTVEIVSESDSLSRLRKYMGDDQIPTDYGGSSSYPFFQHPMELRLRETVAQASVTVESLREPDKYSIVPTDTFESAALGPSPFMKVTAFSENSSDTVKLSSNQAAYEDNASEDDAVGTMCWHFAPVQRKAIILSPDNKSFDPRPAIAQKFWYALTNGFGDSCTGRNPVL